MNPALATLSASINPTASKRNIDSFRRENSFRGSFTMIDMERGWTPLDARFYGNGTTSYCVVWLHADGYGVEIKGPGMGKAGGYGYHKDSAALDLALRDMGVTLSEPIDGRGEQAMNAAFSAIAKALGVNRFKMVHAHP